MLAKPRCGGSVTTCYDIPTELRKLFHHAALQENYQDCITRNQENTWGEEQTQAQLLMKDLLSNEKQKKTKDFQECVTGNEQLAIKFTKSFLEVIIVKEIKTLILGRNNAESGLRRRKEDYAD